MPSDFLSSFFKLRRSAKSFPEPSRTNESACAYSILYSIFIAIVNALSVYPKRLWDFHRCCHAVRRINSASKGNDMQRCSTGCRLLLIAPALFVLLQVAHVLHRHHFDSYYDAEESLNSFPAAFYPDHIKQDTLIRLASPVLASTPSSLWIRTPDSPEAAITVLIADPPQSRAPPLMPFS